MGMKSKKGSKNSMHSERKRIYLPVQFGLSEEKKRRKKKAKTIYSVRGGEMKLAFGVKLLAIIWCLWLISCDWICLYTEVRIRLSKKHTENLHFYSSNRCNFSLGNPKLCTYWQKVRWSTWIMKRLCNKGTNLRTCTWTTTYLYIEWVRDNMINYGVFRASYKKQRQFSSSFFAVPEKSSSVWQPQ